MQQQLELIKRKISPYPVPALHYLPLRERPARRVAQGAVGCNLPELLAAIVGGSHQVEIAYALMERFGDITKIAQASVQEIVQTHGLGDARAAALKAALELGRRVVLAKQGEQITVQSPGDVAQLLMAEMSHLEQEHFRVLFLDTRNRLLGTETVYVGSLNATNIRVAEVFREAVKRNCAAIIITHNHPSGDPSPSPEDVEVTRQLVSAGELLNIQVLDHLIIGQRRFVSMRERGLGFSS